MRKIAAVARTHHSLISLPQARRLGVSDDALRRAVRSGHLERLHPGVFRITGALITTEQRILAAVLACGPSAKASHRSAARLWGTDRPAEDPVDVIVGRTCSPVPTGVVVHRPTDRDELRSVMRGTIPTVTPLRMLLDLGAVDRWGVQDALDSVLAQRLMTLEAVNVGLIAHARKGRSGVAALRRAIEERRIDGQPGDSELEVTMAKLRLSHGLPDMQFHAVIAGYEVDFLVVGVPVVIECDGWTTHGLDRDQFDFDRQRDVELLAAGYITVRVTWRQLTRSPGRTAARINAAIEAASRFSAA